MEHPLKKVAAHTGLGVASDEPIGGNSMTLKSGASTSITMTEEEYLQSESKSTDRREYIDGQVYAMAGATMNHIRITANVLRFLGNHLVGKPCEAIANDMRAKVANNYFYPDVMVVCDHHKTDGITDNPLLIVEVLSSSTRQYDLTTKLLHYINLPSLEEYVLIEQDVVRIEVLRKSNDWKYETYSMGTFITFESIDLTLSVEEIYDRVENNEMNEFRQSHL